MVKMELRPEQLRTFQATGYLVLPSLVDEPTLRAWRAQIWSAIGADAAEPSTWPHRRGTPSVSVLPAAPWALGRPAMTRGAGRRRAGPRHQPRPARAVCHTRRRGHAERRRGSVQDHRA